MTVKSGPSRPVALQDPRGLPADRPSRLAGLLATARSRRRARPQGPLAPLWSPLAAPSDGLPAPRTLDALLAPEAGLTPFRGRDEELGELLRWCTNRAAAPVRVLAGAGGVGKSRLAVELARALPQGWRAGFARPGTAAQIVPAAAAEATSVLVVVDDADSEPGLDVAALVGHAACTRVRVLLVVRDAATFGEHVQVATGETTTLRAVGADGDRRRSFADGVRGFSDGAELPPWAEPDRGPVGVDEEPMAIIQARAALAVLGDDPDYAMAMRTADVHRLTAAILAAERRRWSCDGFAPDAQEEAVLALLLRGPRGIEDAVSTLRALPRFRDAAEDEVRDIATWAHRQYPGRAGGPWLDPRPALVGAALLTLATHPDRSALVGALDLPTAAARDPEVVARLARAAADHPCVAALLSALFTGARLATMVEATVLAGVHGLRLRNQLVAALSGRSLAVADVGRLLTITEASPWSAVRVAVRRAEVAHLREVTAAGDDRSWLAAALTNLGDALRDVGAHADALAPAREAVQLYRDLAAARPDPHTADLAAALTRLAICLRTCRAYADARAATREAVRLYRDLGPAPPTPGLAHALTTLGVDLREAGAFDDALVVAREAVEVCRGLAADAPARHSPDLAAALTGLGACLRETGTFDAVAATREAVQLHRDVAANKAEPHSAELARALTDLAADLRDARTPDEAGAAGREAVQRWRDLVATDPARHTPDLARALTILGAALREVGSYAAGLAAAREAVTLYRGLAAADPARHTPDLARALTQLGIGLRGLGPRDDDLAPAREAVALYRGLAAADPARHTPGLARALTQLGIGLRGHAAHDAALSATSEAVALNRELVVADPARHTADLARSLISLGAGLRALGRRPEAVLHECDAVAWWWHLTQQRPGEFDDKYRDAQGRYFRTFSRSDHDPDALLTAELIARGRVLRYLENESTENALVDRPA